MSTPDIKFTHITYDDFLADIEAIAVQIERGDWTPNFIVGSGRGGLAPMPTRRVRPRCSTASPRSRPGFACSCRRCPRAATCTTTSAWGDRHADGCLPELGGGD